MDPANTEPDTDLEAANEERVELGRLIEEVSAAPEEEDEDEDEDDEDEDEDDEDEDDEDEDEDEDDDVATDEEGNEMLKVRVKPTPDEKSPAAPDVSSDRMAPTERGASAPLAIQEIEKLEDDAKGG